MIILRKILLFLLFSLIITCSIGCTSADKTLVVKAAGEKIDCMEAPDDNQISDFQDFPQFTSNESSLSNIKYLKIGEKITLDFGENPPDKVSVKDILLDSKGENLYTDKEIVEAPLTKENNIYYFMVKAHPWSALSSTLTEDKTDIRGFLVTASWGKDEHVYGFAIKTDSEIVRCLP